MPFLAEELYQNLVRSVDADAPESVHMVDWPEYDPAVIDDQLNREMDLVLRLVSLGHAARNKAEIKVRQPLAQIAFSVGSAQEARALEQYADVFADELNVKKVTALGAAGEVVDYRINPLPRQLGSKYQEKFPVIRKALLAMDAGEVAAKLLDEQPVEVSVDGETYTIMPDEVEVHADAKTGLTVAQEGAYMAALSTELTPELISEGMAREFVRRVQDFRKQSDLEISDRIKLYFQASEKLTEIVQEHSEYIMNETLAVELLAEPAPEDALSHEEPFTFEGEELVLGIVVAN